MASAIEIQGLSKRFRLYHEKYTSLKERILHAGHVPYEEFWALRDVEAEIAPGQTVGILGRNGSGKSTLLKCIAGILQPTSGQVVVRGQLAAMLELGAGFQPELSGRDNIYLNGSLLGFSRREIDRRFDAIVEFAELSQFIDNQVKYYSSGMYVRLGFAVAVNVEPDVLLVDEVLSVGDERFQMKCLERVREFQKEGRTIVVVSHAAEMIRQVCENVIVIDGGEIVTIAPPGEAISSFRDRLVDGGVSLPAGDIGGPAHATAHHTRQVKIGEVTIEHAGQLDHSHLLTGDTFTIRMGIEVAEPIAGVEFGVTILSAKNEIVFSTIGAPLGNEYVLDRGIGEVAFAFDAIPFLDGHFVVNLEVRDSGGAVIDFVEDAARLTVVYNGHALGLVDLPMHVEVQAPGTLLDRSQGARTARA